MTRRLVNVTLDNLGELPRQCRGCVFWELDPGAGRRATEVGDADLEKEAWLSATLLDWGACGKLICVDDSVAGFGLYAPPMYVPRSVTFPTSPVSPDAVLLMTARVLPEFAGVGLGRMLIQGLASDLVQRGVRAIEAFGDDGGDVRGAGGTGGGGSPGDGVAGVRSFAPGTWYGPGCVLPAAYLRAVGFKTVRAHRRHPRLRLELRNAVSWREDVEAALDRLLGSIAPEPAFRPA